MAPIDVSSHATTRPRVLAPDLESDVNCAAAIGAPVLISADAEQAEWLARLIHDRSSRRGEPFVVYRPGRANQLALLNALLNGGWPGKGTLFVAEATAMGRDVQRRLRDLLSPVREELRAPFRIMTASSAALFDAVEQGAFDIWLFYLLNEIHIQVPRQERSDRREVVRAANWSPLATRRDGMNVAAFRQHRVMLRSGLDAGTERTTTARRKSEH